MNTEIVVSPSSVEFSHGLATAVANSRVKRSMDVALSITALIVLAPIILLAGAAVIVESGWPPLFMQTRVGLKGVRFKIVKFRTMVRGAESLRLDLQNLNEAPFPAFKVRNDPRLTRVGRLLRRASIDELPQLVNVLRGDMSIVGPRPPLPDEVAHYDAEAWRRLDARPGLTCTWQIEHRHRITNVSFTDWVRMDVSYVNDWSIRTDLALMARTVIAVMRMTGT